MLRLLYLKNKQKELQKKLFGHSKTFRRGQIGAWKTTFEQEHIDAFKQVFGQELIEMGYEQDFDW